jgi:hypothetical protein
MIKKMFAVLGATFGLAGYTGAESTTVDADSIRYSMPTVAADTLNFVMPTKETFEGAPQFHEDEWCQLEFFPKERLSEVKKHLTDFKSFEEKNREQYGWKNIYARRISRDIAFGTYGQVKAVASQLNASPGPAPILFTASNPLGQVGGGFTIPIGSSVFLYGASQGQEITSLGAIVETGGDDQQLMAVFQDLNEKYEYVLVDWRSQFILVGTAPNGKIELWRP